MGWGPWRADPPPCPRPPASPTGVRGQGPVRRAVPPLQAALGPGQLQPLRSAGGPAGGRRGGRRVRRAPGEQPHGQGVA